MSKIRKWTNAEIRFLKENCIEMDNAELAERLGRTKKSVAGKMVATGFTKLRKGQLYEVLRGYEVIATGTAKECAEQLGLSVESIYRLSSLDHFKRQSDLEVAIVAFKIKRDERLRGDELEPRMRFMSKISE